jgi:hypothetical protein
MVRVGHGLAADRAAAVFVIALSAASAALAAPASSARTPRATRTQLPSSLRASADLWATIDVCNPPDQHDTVGIRGSMPSDGQAHDTMFMRFRLQYVDATLKHWIDLANAASGFLPVGPSHIARQAGRSFVLFPPAGGSAFTLRGVVSFQWRRGAKVLGTISRATTAAHRSLAGADPKNFSAATCRIR